MMQVSQVRHMMQLMQDRDAIIFILLIMPQILMEHYLESTRSSFHDLALVLYSTFYVSAVQSKLDSCMACLHF